MAEYVCIPFNQDFYNDIIRFSDGQLNPASLAERQVESYIERNLLSQGANWFGDRLIEFARIHFPEHVESIEAEPFEDMTPSEADAPLRWKELRAVPSGTRVRMHYKGSWYHACVKNGRIEDRDGRFSPAEWASKVADGTSRNAWLDLEFQAAHGGPWRRAEDLRSKARKVQREWEKTMAGGVNLL